jgi:translation initiation factor 1
MPDEPRFNNPFAALGALKGPASKDEAAEKPAPAPAPVAASAPAKTGSTGKTYARAVVRMERSGRGGKEVTVIEQLDLSAADREAWVKALKGSLGCGGVVEGENLMLQGDHRKRLPAILSERGVKKVIVSG